MKNIFYFVAPLAIAVGIAFFLKQWLSQYEDPGYVLIGFSHWSLETSVVFFAVALVFAFFIFYMVFRFLGNLFRMPGKIKNKGKTIKFNRSQEALISGLVDSAEGNFEKAENFLIKHASNSGAPLLHYLTAAKAAQSRGAIEKRDEYLRIANEYSGDTDIAVGLTQAELHLSANQFDQALETLSRLQSIDSGHASVLKLLHQTYRSIGDWDALRKLIPSLDQNKVLMEAEVKLLERETLINLLKQTADHGDSEKIKTLWQSFPEHIKSVTGIANIYFATMIENGASAEIEQEIVQAIVKNWDETLLILYANIDSEDSIKQLQTAEQWLPIHSGSSVLLRVLGKISIKNKQMEKAEQYLTKSVGIEPSVAVYQMLGDILIEKGDAEKASQNYKKGLEMASLQVVEQVDTITD